ncbi:aminotransferase class III-fold pyridoxal phosphate-dependent enzyme [Micromonospora parva]|uniref:aminotransferase class III-fold pyridoxal phosphate-dependent enzyme n=1 Tax=Micromonospora parva TaxID=1464048 RepID=UPI003798D424
MGASHQERGAIEVIQDLMQQKWVYELFGEIGARQGASAAHVEQLRAVDAAAHVFWPFQAPPFPIIAATASGSTLTDIDGNDYLDCHMGYGAQALHGHNPAPVVDFVRERLGKGTGNGYTNALELELATLLREILPHNEKFAFQHSGTGATQSAIRLCRAFTGRRMVAKFEGTLHGSHDLAVHNTAPWYHGHPAVPFPEIGKDGIPLVSAFAGVTPAEPRDLLILPNDTALAVELIERHAGELACILAEPAASSFPFEETTIPMIREVAVAARRLGVPFILDEVLTGFRSGLGGAAQKFDIPTDLVTYGKVISGLGLPLSAIGGRADILDISQTSGQSWTDFGQKTGLQGSHTGNYLSVAASLATLQLLRDKGPAYYTDLSARIDRVQARLAAFRAAEGIPLRMVGFGDYIGCFQFLPEDSYTDYRVYSRALNPATFILTLLLRKRGIYTLGMPMFFAGGAHSDADVDRLTEAVLESTLELRANDFPFDLAWPATSQWGSGSAEWGSGSSDWS